MINRNGIGGANNQIKLTIQTDSSKIQPTNLKTNDANQKIKQVKGNSSTINTPLTGNNSTLLGSHTVKNLRMNNLISPSSQMLMQTPFANPIFRQSQQMDNNTIAQIIGQSQLGIQKNEIYQLKKDSMQRPSTAAAAAAQLAGKNMNRKQMINIANYYQQYMMQDVNQEKQDQMQIENQLAEQDIERYKIKRPQTAFSNIRIVSSSISSEFQQDLEQKMHFIQVSKDNLNSALQGIETDDKNKIIEVEEPKKQELKQEHGVYNEIMNRRKMKFLNCSQGLEYLKHNKKILRINKDVKQQQEIEKRYNNNLKILNVLENKRYQDNEKKDMLVRKIDDQEKRRLVSQINRIGNQLDEVLKRFQNSWLQVFSLVSLAAKLKRVIHCIFFELIQYFKNSKERNCKKSINQLHKNEEKKGNSRTYKFFEEVWRKQIPKNTILIEDNKFSSYKRKKIKYKDEIKRYWSNQNDYLIQLVLQDMLNSNKQTNNLNMENFLKNEMKKSQKSVLKMDFKLQDEIVNQFVKQRIQAWRREFTQFKRSNFQLFNLKKLLQQEKDNKDNPKIAQQLQKHHQMQQLSPSESLTDLFAEPPKLFVKPNETQLKQMVKQYMAAKRQSAESQTSK